VKDTLKNLGNYLQQLSSPIRVFLLSCAVILILLLFTISTVSDSDSRARERVSHVLNSAIISKVDSLLLRVRERLMFASQDEEVSKVTRNILSFHAAQNRLDALLVSDPAILSAFVMNGSDFVIAAAPNKAAGLRSERLVDATKNLMNDIHSSRNSPTLMVLSNEDLKLGSSFQRLSNNWLLMGMPLTIDRRKFLEFDEATGVIWLLIDLETLLFTLFDENELIFKGVDALKTKQARSLLPNEFVVSPMTPVFFNGVSTKLQIYIEQNIAPSKVDFVLVINVLLAVICLGVIALFAGREKRRLLKGIADVANGSSPPISIELKFVADALQSIEQKSRNYSSQQLQDKVAQVEIEATERSFKRIAKLMQNRLDDPLLKLSLANSVLQQYSSDRGLIPIVEDIQSALHQLQYHNDQLQTALRGEISLGSQRHKEVALHELLVKLHHYCRDRAVQAVLNVDPLIRNQVLLLEEPFEQALMAIARCRKMVSFGLSFGVHVAGMNLGETSQNLRFVFFNDLHRDEFISSKISYSLEQNPVSSSSINAELNDLELRLAATFLKCHNVVIHLFNSEVFGPLLYFDIDLSISDREVVITDLLTNLTQSLGLQYDA